MGGVSWDIKKLIDDRSVTNFKNRILIAGEVSNEILAALIQNASAFILPISEGGGSNLKTASALASSKAIVGTSKAFLGFEDYRTAPGVYIADDREDFYKSLVEVSFQKEKNNFFRLETETQPLLWTTIFSKLDRILET